MNNLLNGVYGIAIKITLVVALCGGLYGGYKYKVHQAVTEAVHVVKVQQAAETFRQKEIIFDKAQEEKNKLQSEFDTRQKEKDAKIKTLNSDVSSLLLSLRERPTREASNSRSGTSSTPDQSSTNSTGKGLFRDDAEFLTRFASDTETLRLGLLQCYADYAAVKKSVESFSDKK